MATRPRGTVRWPPPTYVVRVRFRAPRDFVYRWCTDYGPRDAVLEGESYRRRVIARSEREVIYEDLDDTPDGWFWSRHVVRLYPGVRWHSESIGSHRAYSLDYRLTSPEPGSTEMVLTARRRPYGHGGPNPPKGSWERSVAKSWRGFARALEADYRAAARRRPRAR